ncbi:MAG: DivIVA domain-containing protein [Oscillospiraceae bacterium]|jgi:cell division initiation protein|nr:DivIVA domain-containing protein [Oscillospiraceae bacterium]MCI8715742.1 DivIVA domain-containing protein [Oscillospiraceae bacterium]MDE6934640.1 DivIVA domain-containing protein [Oscillospiraceae bacterium]
MMTPQDVANCTFAKSMMGGYNMASVDDFLDKLTEDYTALFKENAALKAKLKVTVDKMSEYRESEDAIRTTLLTAQKMATALVSEAEQKRDAMIADTSRAAKARLAEIKQEVAMEEKRLADVRSRVSRELEAERRRLSTGQEQLRSFIRDVTNVCNEQLAMLELLPELPPESAAPPPPVLPAVPAVPAVPSVPSVPAEPGQAAAASAAVRPEAAPAQEPEVSEEEAEEVRRNLQATLSVFAPAREREEPPAAPVGDPFAEDALPAGGDMDDTRVLNLDDLQFGRNYSKD